MYKVGDKFDLRDISDFFCEIIGLIPGGQSQKETMYIVSFAGTKFNLPETVFDVLFEKKEAKKMALDIDTVFKNDEFMDIDDSDIKEFLGEEEPLEIEEVEEEVVEILEFEVEVEEVKKDKKSKKEQ